MSPPPGASVAKIGSSRCTDVRLAADHQAVAALEAPDAAARADVDVVDALRRQLAWRGGCRRRSSELPPSITMSPGSSSGSSSAMRRVDDRRRHHQPDARAASSSFVDEVVRATSRRSRLPWPAPATASGDTSKTTHAWPPRMQAPHHVRAHPAEADHSELHRLTPCSRAVERVGADVTRTPRRCSEMLHCVEHARCSLVRLLCDDSPSTSAARSSRSTP